MSDQSDGQGSIRTIKCSLDSFCTHPELLKTIKERAVQIDLIQRELLHFLGIELRMNCVNRSVRCSEAYTK